MRGISAKTSAGGTPRIEHVQERVRKYQKDHPQKVQETRQDRLTKRQAAQRRAELVRLRLANARLTESAKSRPDWQTRRHAPAAAEYARHASMSSSPGSTTRR
jgi:hypothetical protein